MKIPDINSYMPLNKTEGMAKNENIKTAKDPQLEKSAKDLEALFLGFVIKTMEKSLSVNPGGPKNSLAQMMFSSVMSQEIAENGGVGLGEFIYKSLAENGTNPMDKFRKEYSTEYLNVLNNLRSGDE